jgi:hypothetical protein
MSKEGEKMKENIKSGHPVIQLPDKIAIEKGEKRRRYQ